MMKRILIFMTVAMMLTVAQTANAQAPQEVQQKAQTEVELAAVTISVNESTIHIKNALNATFEVYNLAGVKVCSQKIDSSDKTIELNNLPKGCYILKVGKTVRKVYLK